MADYIYTVSKKKFYPLSPRIEDIDIADIAHALSMIARANGHFPQFHSVAQHSIECAREALARGLGSKIALACLLHDGAEAYMADVTTPVKSRLADYRVYEDKLIDMIYQKFIGALSDEEKQIVYQIDKELLYHEFYEHMHIELSQRPEIKTSPDFGFRPFDEVKREYLELFEKLNFQV